jgi:hypothetical protein
MSVTSSPAHNRDRWSLPSAATLAHRSQVTLLPSIDQSTDPPTEHRLVIVVGLVECQLVEVLRKIDLDVEQGMTAPVGPP